MRSRTEIFEEATRKRGPPEPIDGLDLAKRQRLGAEVSISQPNRLYIPPLKPGPHTIAELFTLSNDAAGFDVSGLAEDMVVKMDISILQFVDLSTFTQAINVKSIQKNGEIRTDMLLGCSRPLPYSRCLSE
jgi:symplekin